MTNKDMLSLGKYNKGIRVLRNGLYLGECKKNRFEPGHALALSLSKDDVKQYYSYKETDECDEKHKCNNDEDNTHCQSKTVAHYHITGGENVIFESRSIHVSGTLSVSR